jgi:hypothetical protein
VSKLVRWFRGGSDEFGWDDLVRQIAEAVAALARHGPRGQVAFPAEVAVRIAVGEGSLAVVRQFVDRPELDVEVGEALANRCDCEPSALPMRDYAVVADGATEVTARERDPRPWTLDIEGGDLSGSRLDLPAAFVELRFGRGAWHGPDHHVRNDLVVCERTEFVSRRAGRFTRSGNRLEVEALDQGDALVVQRPGGEQVRPARTARGAVAVGAGDIIELGDRRGAAVRLTLGRPAGNED